ncbi:hypothetical protein KY285_000959 [Solanum tuberosum]|nr:hypothetical protein KY285_000959 [Solanum tuberosum]
MRLCSHSRNIKRDYEGLPELHHSQLEPVGNVRSSSSQALLPHKLLSFPFINATEEQTIRKREEKKSHSDQGSSNKLNIRSHKGSKKMQARWVTQCYKHINNNTMVVANQVLDIIGKEERKHNRCKVLKIMKSIAGVVVKIKY